MKDTPIDPISDAGTAMFNDFPGDRYGTAPIDNTDTNDGRVRRSCRHNPLPSEPRERVTPHTAQAIYVLQEVRWCCESGDDSTSVRVAD